MKKWFISTAIAALTVFGAGIAKAESLLPTLAATDWRFTNYNGYYISWAHGAIGLSSAWKYNWTTKTFSGFTGRGVKVAVFDTGLDQYYKSKFQLATGYNLYGNNGNGARGVNNDNGWHGTFVSGIIGANMNKLGSTVYGVAPNSTIMPIQIFDRNGQATWTDQQLAKAINYAASNGAMVMNNSWNHSSTLAEIGGAGAIPGLQNSMRNQISAWRNAIGNQGSLVVFAAGNYGKSDPGYFASLPLVDQRLRGGWVAVVATGGNGSIANWSNRCGVAADWCMAAPGEGIIGLYKGTLATGNGTSFAAPMVSAAAALMLEKWPSLKGTDVQKILFQTANKTGIYADRSIYGQGMLDLAKAFAPIGNVAIASGATTNTAGIKLSDTGITPSSAFGVSLANALGKVDTIALDDYKRDFQVNLGNGVGDTVKLNYWGNQLATFGATEMVVGDSVILNGSANGITSTFATTEDDAKVDDKNETPAAWSVSIMQSKKFEPYKSQIAKNKPISQAKTSVGVNVSPSFAYGAFANNSIRGNDLVLINSVGNPYMNMAPNSTSASISYKWNDNHTTRVGAFTNTVMYDTVYNIRGPMPLMTGFNIEHTVKGDIGYISASAGVVNEQNTVLGSYSSGALSLGQGANTAFAGLSAGINLWNNIQMFGGTTVGYTLTQSTPESLIKNIKNLTSSNAYAGIVKKGVFTDNDRFGVIGSLPMRVNTGVLELSVPTGQDANGVLSYNNRSVALRNNTVEYSLQAFYTLPIDQWQSIGVSTGARFNALDLKNGATSELISMARYNLRF